MHPVKLPTSRCPSTGSRCMVRNRIREGWYFNGAQAEPSLSAWPVDRCWLSVWLCNFLLVLPDLASGCHPQLRVRHQLTLTYLSLTMKTFNFRPAEFRSAFSLLMSVFSKEGEMKPSLNRYRKLSFPMAKVGSLDPRISDNHTYLPWVVTHSIQDSSFQAHIRKVNSL
jgi:hypothetical protein